MESDRTIEQQTNPKHVPAKAPDFVRIPAVSAGGETSILSHSDQSGEGPGIESPIKKTEPYELENFEKSYTLLKDHFQGSCRLFDTLQHEGHLSTDTPPLRDSPLSSEEQKQLAALHKRTISFDQLYSEILTEAHTILSESHPWVQEEQKVAQSMRDAHIDSAYDNLLYSPSGLLAAHRADLSYQEEALMMLKGKYEVLGRSIPSEAIERIDKALKEESALQESHKRAETMLSREIDESRLQAVRPVLDVYAEAEELFKSSKSARFRGDSAELENFNKFIDKLEEFINHMYTIGGKKGFGPFLYATTAIRGEQKWHEIEGTPPRDLERIWQDYQNRYETDFERSGEKDGVSIRSYFDGDSKGGGYQYAENKLFPKSGEFVGTDNKRFPGRTAGQPLLYLSEIISAQIRYYNEHRAELGSSQNLPPFHLRKYIGTGIANRQTESLVTTVKNWGSGPLKQEFEYPEGSRGYYAMVLAETAKSKFWLARQEGLRCSKVQLLDGEAEGEFEIAFHFTRSRPLPLG